MCSVLHCVNTLSLIGGCNARNVHKGCPWCEKKAMACPHQIQKHVLLQMTFFVQELVQSHSAYGACQIN